MQLRKFANPWCLLCGAVAGGLAWAVTLPVWAAFVIAVIIWLTAVLVFGFLFPTAPSETELPADPGAFDACCARRAHAAAASLQDVAAPFLEGPLGDRVSRIVWRAGEIAASIDHLVRRSQELSALVHNLAQHPHSRGRARYVESRHAEIRRRMYAATRDLEAAVPRFLATASPGAAPDVAALDRLATDLENIGYGVDIGESMVTEILGPEPPRTPQAPAN